MRILDTAARRAALEAASAAEAALEAAVAACEASDDDWRGETAEMSETPPQPRQRGGRGLTADGLVAVLRELYPTQRVIDLLYQDSPWLAKFERHQPAGAVVAAPVQVPEIVGGCFCYAPAPTWRTPTVLCWELSAPVYLHSVATITGHALMRDSHKLAGELHSCLRTASARLVARLHQELASELDQWLPAETPGSDPWCGIDRSVDPARLAGQRVMTHRGSGPPRGQRNGDVLDGLLELLIRIARDGGRPDLIVCGTGVWDDLRADKITGPNGSADVVCDPTLPKLDCYALQSSDWRLLELPPQIDALRCAASDDYEVRLSYAARLACLAPAHSGRLVVAETACG